MRSFREFFNESALKLPFAGGTPHTGHFDLPDLLNLHDPETRPEAGWGSIQQVGKAAVDAHRSSYSDTYIMRHTLVKCQALAENVMSAIQLRERQLASGYTPPVSGYQKNYEHAQFDQAHMLISGITKNEIIGGEYPRFRNEEMDRAEQLSILYPQGQNSPYWILNINTLRHQMEVLKERLEAKEKTPEAQEKPQDKIPVGVNTAAELKKIAAKEISGLSVV